MIFDEGLPARRTVAEDALRLGPRPSTEAIARDMATRIADEEMTGRLQNGLDLGDEYGTAPRVIHLVLRMLEKATLVEERFTPEGRREGAFVRPGAA